MRQIGIHHKQTSKLRFVLEFGMSGIAPEPQDVAHRRETEAGRHDRANFRMRLQQPLRHEVVFCLAGDVDDPCVPSCAVLLSFGTTESAIGISQVVTLALMRYLVLAAMRDAIRNASHANCISIHSTFLIMCESVLDISPQLNFSPRVNEFSFFTQKQNRSHAR